jgi:hypothetical protein
MRTLFGLGIFILSSSVWASEFECIQGTHDIYSTKSAKKVSSDEFFLCHELDAKPKHKAKVQHPIHK